MHYVSRGRGKPLLFLHGFPQFWFLRRRQLEDLGARTNCRLRGGHAGLHPLLPSRRIPEAYRMRHLLCGHPRSRRTSGPGAASPWIGHDWGGIVSWAFALKYPELLESFVIIDAPPPFTWNRDLRESPKQREAVNYMLELSKPSPEPEEMLAGRRLRMVDASWSGSAA